MKKIDTVTFTATLQREGSRGASDLGTYESTMDLYMAEDGYRGCIEWDIPDLEITEEIGLWLEHKVLVDYDGVGSLPTQAIELIRKNGYVVPKEME